MIPSTDQVVKPIPSSSRENHTWIKICGLTRPDDVEAAADAGADAIGLVFWPQSPRAVDVPLAVRCARIARKRHMAVVGVFVKERMEIVVETIRQVGLHTVQCHYPIQMNELETLSATGIPVIRLFDPDQPAGRVDEVADAWIVDGGTPDQPGGSGKRCDWTTIARLTRPRPLILAGGLNPSNIIAALDTVHPQGVDVSSGVCDRDIRHKSARLMAEFVREVRNHTRQCGGQNDSGPTGQS